MKISRTLIVTHIAPHGASFEIPIYMFSNRHLNRMKRIFTALISTVLLATTAFAQVPANDNCSGVITLTPTAVGGACPTTIYTNVGATDATGAINSPNASCFNGLRAFKDVWFKFTTTSGSNVNYRVSIKGTNAADSIKNPQVALYVGNCTSGLVEEYCATKDVTRDTNGISIDAGCMRPNTDYYIQVASYVSNDIGGKFTVCVQPIDPIYTMKAQPQTTTACLGTLYDSGGPTSNYGNNENNWTFNIRPQGTGCIEVTIDSFSMEATYDSLTIYDGNTGALLDKITGLTNRTIVFQAPTNWIRVVFKSDGTTNARGFKLTWKSSLACSAPLPTSCSAPEIIPSLPFSRTNTTNCNDAISTITTSPCPATANGFLGGKDHVYKFTSTGGQCVNIFLTNLPQSLVAGSMNFGLYRNCPAGAGSECIGTGKPTANKDSSFLKNISLTIPGDYYLVVSSRDACSSYNIKMDTVTCLNNLPNAGFCDKAVSINGCASGVSNLLVDLSQQGDLGFMDFTTALYSGNRGCINTYGGTPPRANFTFLKFKAQSNGKFGFLINPITQGAVDVDFNVYGPIDNEADICTFAKNNAPARSSYASSFTGPGSNITGLADSYRTPAGALVNVTDDIDCNAVTPDGIVRRMDVVKDKYYLIWINDFLGVIGRDGVRLDFTGSGDSVLSSAQTAAIAGRDTALCIGGSTQLFAQGGITYKWTPALGLSRDTASRPVATPLVSTVYNVEIQQACQLVAKKVNVLVFNVKDIPNQTVCRNEDLVFDAGEVYPATSGAVWSWTSSTNNISELSATNVPNPTFRATGAAGTHIFTVTLTTPSCTLSKTVTITVTPQAAPVYDVITSLTAKRDTNVCTGQPFNLLKFGFDNTATYTWASTPTTNITGNNPAVQPSSSLKYYVSVTGGVGGCTAVSKDSVIVNVYQAPLVNVISDTSLCRDLVISLGNTAAQANTTYSWNDRIGFDNPNALNPNLTVRPGTYTYTLRATNLGGCTIDKSVRVTGIDLRMKINATEAIKLCRGTPLNLTTTITPANARIKWSSNRDFTIPIDSTTANITVNPITRSRYYADVSLGNCRRIDSVDVLVDSLPLDRTILPKDTTVCIGAIVLLRSPVYEPIFYPTLTFKWTPTFGAITPDSFYNIVINADQTRTYSRVATSGACRVTDTVRINVNPIPTLILAPRDTQLCEPATSVRLTVTTPNQGVTGYKWKVNGQDATGSNDQTFISLVPGPGTTTILVSAKIGDCPANASTTIKVNPLPAVSFPVAPTNILCVGGSLILNQQPNAAYTYVWSGPALSSTTASAPTATPTVDNSKYVVKVTNPTTGCSKTDSTVVRLAVGTLDSINPVGVCSGTPNPSITANGTTTVGTGSYSWSSGEKGAAISPSSSVTGTYTVTYTFGNNCTLSRSVKVTSIPGFSLRINPDSFSKARLIDQGTSITLTANGTGNTGTLSYVWTADGNAAGTTQAITFKANGDATYKVSATSSTTCKKDTSVSLSIRYPNYKLPNAFTPNADTINSFFSLIFNGINPPSPTDPRPQFWKGNISVLSFQVFNRWGQEVYGETASAVLNAATYKGWNGKKDGKDDGTEQASDVYVYLIKLKMPDDTIKVESGELNLIR
jgi:CHU_C Type IX secretion signal domain/CUB domain